MRTLNRLIRHAISLSLSAFLLMGLITLNIMGWQYYRVLVGTEWHTSTLGTQLSMLLFGIALAVMSYTLARMGLTLIWEAIWLRRIWSFSHSMDYGSYKKDQQISWIR